MSWPKGETICPRASFRQALQRLLFYTPSVVSTLLQRSVFLRSTFSFRREFTCTSFLHSKYPLCRLLHTVRLLTDHTQLAFVVCHQRGSLSEQIPSGCRFNVTFAGRRISLLCRSCKYTHSWRLDILMADAGANLCCLFRAARLVFVCCSSCTRARKEHVFVCCEGISWHVCRRNY